MTTPISAVFFFVAILRKNVKFGLFLRFASCFCVFTPYQWRESAQNLLLVLVVHFFSRFTHVDFAPYFSFFFFAIFPHRPRPKKSFVAIYGTFGLRPGGPEKKCVFIIYIYIYISKTDRRSQKFASRRRGRRRVSLFFSPRRAKSTFRKEAKCRFGTDSFWHGEFFWPFFQKSPVLNLGGENQRFSRFSFLPSKNAVKHGVF